MNLIQKVLNQNSSYNIEGRDVYARNSSNSSI